MEISSPQILLMFVVMGGVIAYLGDWLGRKMGKKRLRIGGMRPRHTATFFTVLMGMLIPVATTYAIVTISAPVRQWLAEGPELAKERDKLVNQIATLRRTATARDNELKQQEGKLQQAVFERKQASNQKTAAEKEMQHARTDLRVAAASQRKVQARVQHLLGREQELSTSVQQKTKQLDDQERVLNSSLAEVTRLRKESDALLQNSVTLNRQIHDLEERTKEEMKRADDARKQRDTAEREAQQWYERIIDLRKIVMDLQQSRIGLERGIEAVRTRNILFRKGEELARLTLTGGLDEASARTKINQLVSIADVSAKERGVKPDTSGKAAGLSEILRRLPDGSVLTISVDDQVNAFIREIGRTRQDLLLIASAYYNYFDADERFVPLELNMFINRVVYKGGDIVAEATIDGALAESEIFDAVIEFLRTNVRSSAETAGMIPIHGQEGSVGEVSYQQMTWLVRQLRERGVPCKVIATAGKTTKTAETLELKFKIAKP